MKMKQPQIKRQPRQMKKLLDGVKREMSEKSQVRVGLPAGSGDYPDGTSVIMVGAVHEFGSAKRNVSERSFLRSTVREQRRAYKRLMGVLGQRIATGKLGNKKALQTLGLTVEKDVKDKITDIKTPALKYRDGNPLIDTGLMRQSITHEIDK